jgi:hypothetical protein
VELEEAEDEMRIDQHEDLEYFSQMTDKQVAEERILEESCSRSLKLCVVGSSAGLCLRMIGEKRC